MILTLSWIETFVQILLYVIVLCVGASIFQIASVSCISFVAEQPYDSIPNFSAADALRLTGIGRNEFIDIMNKCRSKVTIKVAYPVWTSINSMPGCMDKIIMQGSMHEQLFIFS